MTENKCLSCKKRIDSIMGSAIFKCPKCSETEIIRCGDCRKIAAPYKCHKCGFEGPN